MPKIHEYDFGRIVVDDVEQTRDIILLSGPVVPNWWRQDGHRLVLQLAASFAAAYAKPTASPATAIRPPARS